VTWFTRSIHCLRGSTLELHPDGLGAYRVVEAAAPENALTVPLGLADAKKAAERLQALHSRGVIEITEARRRKGGSR
jgi:hypothetical protein